MAIDDVIVTGPVRSGTTLAARRISNEILGLPYLGEAPELVDLLQEYERLLHPPGVGDLRLAYDKVQRQVAGRMGISQSRGLCLKSPMLVDHAEALAEVVERLGLSAIVVCVRHPLAILASALRVQARSTASWTVDDAIHQAWRTCDRTYALIRRFEQKALPFYLLKFEDHVRSPSRQMAELVDFLGISYSGPSVGPPASNSFDRLNPYFTELMEMEPQPSRLEGWKQELPVGLNPKIYDAMWQCAEALGYGPEGSL